QTALALAPTHLPEQPYTFQPAPRKYHAFHSCTGYKTAGISSLSLAASRRYSRYESARRSCHFEVGSRCGSFQYYRQEKNPSKTDQASSICLGPSLDSFRLEAVRFSSGSSDPSVQWIPVLSLLSRLI